MKTLSLLSLFFFAISCGKQIQLTTSGPVLPPGNPSDFRSEDGGDGDGTKPDSIPDLENPPPALSLDFKINDGTNDLTVPYRSSIQLSWSSQNAISCSLKTSNNNLLSSEFSSPGLFINDLVSSETFTLNCSRPEQLLTKTISVTVANPTDNIVFVSSSVGTGNLGGLVGADARCLANAIAAGLRPDRNWKAILSDDQTSAASRIMILGQVRNTNGEIVASGAAELWSGDLANGVCYTENKVLINVSADNTWTGSNASGNSTGDSCDDWSTTAGSGTGGVSSATNGTWMNDDLSGCDDPDKRLYCISQ